MKIGSLGTHWIRSFIAFGPLTTRCRTPSGRTGSGVPVRYYAGWNALDPGIHCVRAHWNRGFMAFRLARRTWGVMVMVRAWPESGSGKVPPGCGRLLTGNTRFRHRATPSGDGVTGR
jgi:hypothetical protein